MVAPFSKFSGKIWVGFCLNTGKRFFLEISFWSGYGTRDFQDIALRLRDWHAFMWESVEILNVCNTLTLKQILRKTKTFFKKLKYRFLVESTKIENALFSYKSAISEANVKTNRMVSTKWTYHKERIFASNYFIFWKFYFSFRTLYKELIWCANEPNVHIRTFRKHWSFIWRYFFPVSILKYKCWGAIFSSFMYSMRKWWAKLSKLFSLKSILRWGAQ